MKKPVRILQIILLSLLLIAICFPGVFSFNSYTYPNASRYTAGGCRLDERVDKIDINWLSGKVNVARHSGDRIILSEDASRKLKKNEEMHWLLKGDTLYVKYAQSGKKVPSRAGKEMTLLIPESMDLDEVLITCVSADTEADLPAAESVQIVNVSGKADVTFSRTESVHASTVSGDVTLHFETAPESIETEAVSADVNVELPKKAGFSAEMTSISGRITGRLAEGNENSKSCISGNGDCRIEADSVSGNLRLDPFVN